MGKNDSKIKQFKNVLKKCEKKLFKRGIIFKQQWWCCMTCGNSAMETEFEKNPKYENLKGYLYYHDQTYDGIKENIEEGNQKITFFTQWGCFTPYRIKDNGISIEEQLKSINKLKKKRFFKFMAKKIYESKKNNFDKKHIYKFLKKNLKLPVPVNNLDKKFFSGDYKYMRKTIKKLFDDVEFTKELANLMRGIKKSDYDDLVKQVKKIFKKYGIKVKYENQDKCLEITVDLSDKK